jgi:hypothetical protein
MSIIGISGRAGSRETAAILAVVARVLEEETATTSPPPRPEQTPWVLAWRPKETPAPLPSDRYDVAPWVEGPPGDDDEAIS